MNGVERIAAERKRQIEEEGFDHEHDVTHVFGELAVAASCYAAPEPIYVKREVRHDLIITDPWPWSDEWDKRHKVKPSLDQRIRDLEKAGALIAAEIDRLLRDKEIAEGPLRSY